MDDLIIQFEKKLTEDISNSGLPLQVIRLVLAEAQTAVNAEYIRQKSEPKKEES